MAEEIADCVTRAQRLVNLRRCRNVFGGVAVIFRRQIVVYDAKPDRVLALEGFVVAVAGKAGALHFAKEFVDARLDRIDASGVLVIANLDVAGRFFICSTKTARPV